MSTLGAESTFTVGYFDTQNGPTQNVKVSFQNNITTPQMNDQIV